MTGDWDDQERQLRERGAAVRDLLDLDVELARFGTATLTGSAALRVMVTPDIDITVAVPTLNASLMNRVGSLGTRLLGRGDVREVVLRNDTGHWNTDPSYPDGVYLHAVVRDTEGVDWTLDIWFVDEPDRQPDLDHLRTISPRITPEVQERILRLKRATDRRRSDGTPLPSFEIYQAVLEHNVREVSDLRELTEASA